VAARRAKTTPPRGRSQCRRVGGTDRQRGPCWKDLPSEVWRGRALGSLPPVRRRLPAGRGQAPSGRSQRRLSAWELPAGFTVRRRMTLHGPYETAEGSLSVLSWREVRRGMSVPAGSEGTRSSKPRNLGYFRLDWHDESARPRLKEPCRGLSGTQLTLRSQSSARTFVGRRPYDLTVQQHTLARRLRRTRAE